MHLKTHANAFTLQPPKLSLKNLDVSLSVPQLYPSLCVLHKDSFKQAEVLHTGKNLLHGKEMAYQRHWVVNLVRPLLGLYVHSVCLSPT